MLRRGVCALRKAAETDAHMGVALELLLMGMTEVRAQCIVVRLFQSRPRERFKRRDTVPGKARVAVGEVRGGRFEIAARIGLRRLGAGPGIFQPVPDTGIVLLEIFGSEPALQTRVAPVRAGIILLEPSVVMI